MAPVDLRNQRIRACLIVDSLKRPCYRSDNGVGQLAEEFSLDQLRSLITQLCREALAEETESDPPVTFYTRAPEGKTISEEATTVSLNRRARELLNTVVEEIRDKRWSIELSRKELEQEVVTTLFEGTQALLENSFDEDALIESLLSRLSEKSLTWDVYLPILGLELPEGCHLTLAGGTLKELTNDEKHNLRDEYITIWRQARWNSPEKMQSGINKLTEQLEETINSSKFWYHIQVYGRAQSAKNQAVEAAALAMDILRFFALFNGINPEVFNLSFPHQAVTGEMKYLQIAKSQSCELHSELGILFAYRVDEARYAKLTKLPEFQRLQLMSNKPDPTQVEQKALLGIQQYAEATRLPPLGLRLVWYLSSLETVLAKETEGERHKKVERRIGKLLGSKAAERVNPLYDKRRKLVHYGHRNRVGEELITDVEAQHARNLAYLGVVSALREVGEISSHDAFLDHLDALPTNRGNKK